MAGALHALSPGHAKAYHQERTLKRTHIVIFWFKIGLTGHRGHILAPSADSRSCLIWLSPTAHLIVTYIAVIPLRSAPLFRTQPMGGPVQAVKLGPSTWLPMHLPGHSSQSGKRRDVS